MAFADRMQWSIDMQQEHALSYYHDYWNVEEITEVDVEGEDHDGFKRLDFSGIDKIVHTKTQTYHVAQRFRQMRNKEDGVAKPDFSLRYETYNGEPTEYQKLKESHNGIGNTPDVYGFGITPHGRQIGVKDGFKEFYLIDLQRFLKLHFDREEITGTGPIPNGDKSKGLYFDLNQLVLKDCVLNNWSDRKQEVRRPEKPHDITEWVD
jgi:hypothetical protein